MQTLELDIEKYGAVELNHEEMQETDGGFWPIIIIGAALLLEGCTGCQRKNVPSKGNPAPY